VELTIARTGVPHSIYHSRALNQEEQEPFHAKAQRSNGAKKKSRLGLLTDFDAPAFFATLLLCVFA